MQYTTVFFDLDDTLWDTDSNSKESLEQIYYRFGFDKYYETYSEFSSIFFSHNLSLWKAYEHNSITKHELTSRRFYVPFQHIEDLSEEKSIYINQEYMELTASKNKVIEGAKEILEELKSCYKLHILSNGFEEIQYKKMRNSGLTPYFDKIILSDHIGINKPHPDIFHHALKETNTKKEEVIMIGDNWNSDIIGAKNTGIDQIWFNPHNKKGADFSPTYTINKLMEIKNILLT